MGAITTDHRALWPLADVDIPAGWERDNVHNAVYLVGDDTDATDSGGSADHLHEVPEHFLLGDPHDHVFRALSATQNTIAHTTAGSPSLYAAGTHGHDDATSEPETIGYVNAPAFNSTAVDSHPPYIKMIVIKPVDGDQMVPNDAVTLWEDGADPVRCRFTDGTLGTPDCRNRFILGADPAGDGGATGGATTHEHAADHDHDEDDHQHGENVAGDSDNGVVAGPPGGGTSIVLQITHHGVDFQVGTKGGVSTVDLLAGTTSPNLPPYVRLAAIQQRAGRQALHRGMILMYVNTAASLGPDWLVCDGNNGTVNTVDRQIYIVETKSQVGDVGGTDRSADKHGIAAHQHTAAAPHDHDDKIEGEVITTVQLDATTPTAAVAVHSAKLPHSGDHTWEIDDATPTMPENAGLGYSSEADARMPFKGLLFVKYEPTPAVHVLGGHILGGHIASG